MEISTRQSKERRKLEIDSSVQVTAVFIRILREVSLSVESATQQGTVSSGQKDHVREPGSLPEQPRVEKHKRKHRRPSV